MSELNCPVTNPKINKLKNKNKTKKNFCCLTPPMTNLNPQYNSVFCFFLLFVLTF